MHTSADRMVALPNVGVWGGFAAAHDTQIRLQEEM